jgi:hypothetical protein
MKHCGRQLLAVHKLYAEAMSETYVLVREPTWWC